MRPPRHSSRYTNQAASVMGRRVTPPARRAHVPRRLHAGMIGRPSHETPTMRLLPLALLLILAMPTAARAACPPDGWTVEELAALRAGEFKLDDAARRDELALGLLDCLGDADPVLRDGTAFEGLSRWMRGKALSPATLAALRERLQPELATDAPGDALGVRQP